MHFFFYRAAIQINNLISIELTTSELTWLTRLWAQLLFMLAYDGRFTNDSLLPIPILLLLFDYFSITVKGEQIIRKRCRHERRGTI